MNAGSEGSGEIAKIYSHALNCHCMKVKGDGQRVKSQNHVSLLV